MANRLSFCGKIPPHTPYQQNALNKVSPIPYSLRTVNALTHRPVPDFYGAKFHNSPNRVKLHYK